MRRIVGVTVGSCPPAYVRRGGSLIKSEGAREAESSELWQRQGLFGFRYLNLEGTAVRPRQILAVRTTREIEMDLPLFSCIVAREVSLSCS